MEYMKLELFKELSCDEMQGTEGGFFLTTTGAIASGVGIASVEYVYRQP